MAEKGEGARLTEQQQVPKRGRDLKATNEAENEGHLRVFPNREATITHGMSLANLRPPTWLPWYVPEDTAAPIDPQETACKKEGHAWCLPVGIRLPI